MQHTPAIPPGTLQVPVAALASPVPKPVGLVKHEEEKVDAPVTSRYMPTIDGNRQELPTLLSPSSRWPPPIAVAGLTEGVQKETFVDVAGADDDCIILD